MELAKLAWMQLLLAFHANPMHALSRTNANAMMGSISMILRLNASHASATADSAATVLLQINAQTAMNHKSSHLTAHANVQTVSSRIHWILKNVKLAIQLVLPAQATPLHLV